MAQFNALERAQQRKREIAELKSVVETIFDVFRDAELRMFVCGGAYENVEDLFESLKSDTSNLFSMFFGISNAIYAYFVAAFSDKMTEELAFANQKKAKSFCVSRVENALFGLYDTYDVTDDVVKFVVFNATLAIDNDRILQNALDLSFPLNNKLDNEENLLSIFRWMFKLNKNKKNVNKLDNAIKAHYADTIRKLRHLMNYASFLKDVTLQKDGNSESYNFVHNGKTLKSHYVIYKKGSKFLLLRSIETEVNNESSMLLEYTDSNESESGVKTTRELVNATAAEGTSENKYRQIAVKNVGEVYSEISNGLLRVRSRSTFCGGLSGYKYYTELAASIIDALEKLTRSKDKVVDYLHKLITKEKNYAICKDECKCTRPSCHLDSEDGKEDVCSCAERKCFDNPEDLRVECLGNMNLLPILTILLIVAGSKSILPQLFDIVKGDPDALFSRINEQLSLRFPMYDPAKVDENSKQVFDTSKNSLTLSIENEQNLPLRVMEALNKLKARAYTVAIIDKLEEIENRIEYGSARFRIGNVDNYSIKEMLDAMPTESTEANSADIRYAKQCLQRVLQTVLCFYSGLSNCMEKQFQYEIDLENNTSIDIRSSVDSIRIAFFEGIKAEAKELEQLRGNRNNPSFYDLFEALIKLNQSQSCRANINMALGRDIVDMRELNRYVRIIPASKLCLINGKFDLDGDCSDAGGEFLKAIRQVIGYFYNRNSDNGIGIYPQVLTFSSKTMNRDGNIIQKFMFYIVGNRSSAIMEREYNVFSFVDYEINKRYFFVPPRKYENSNWLTHPILIGCSEFCDAVFGNAAKGESNE